MKKIMLTILTVLMFVVCVNAQNVVLRGTNKVCSSNGNVELTLYSNGSCYFWSADGTGFSGKYQLRNGYLILTDNSGNSMSVKYTLDRGGKLLNVTIRGQLLKRCS